MNVTLHSHSVLLSVQSQLSLNALHHEYEYENDMLLIFKIERPNSHPLFGPFGINHGTMMPMTPQKPVRTTTVIQADAIFSLL